MRVLVATHETQGDDDRDFCFCLEGELVRLPMVICRSGDQCGCARAFDGVASQRATTTAKIVERHDLDLDIYPELLYADLADWVSDADDPDVLEWRDDQCHFLHRVAQLLRNGSVVTVERGVVDVRKQGTGSSLLVEGDLGSEE